MTQITLGRVLPIYKGIFDPSTAYVFFDWVRYNGEGFVCINQDGAPIGAALTNEFYWIPFGGSGSGSGSGTIAPGVAYIDPEQIPDGSMTYSKLADALRAEINKIKDIEDILTGVSGQTTEIMERLKENIAGDLAVVREQIDLLESIIEQEEATIDAVYQNVVQISNTVSGYTEVVQAISDTVQRHKQELETRVDGVRDELATLGADVMTELSSVRGDMEQYRELAAQDIEYIQGQVDSLEIQIGQGVDLAAHEVITKMLQLNQDALDQLNEAAAAIVHASLLVKKVGDRVSDAGIYQDPSTGRIKIWGVDVLREEQNIKMSQVQQILDAQKAEILMRATVAQVSEAIAGATFGNVGEFLTGEINARIAAVETRMNANDVSIESSAINVVIQGLQASITQAGMRIDGLEGSVALRSEVEQLINTLDGINARITTAELKVDANHGIISQFVGDFAGSYDDLADATIMNALSDYYGNLEVDIKLAYARSFIKAELLDEFNAEAVARTELVTQIGNLRAAVISEQSSRISGDASISRDVASLFSQVGQNRAAILNEQTTRTTQFTSLAQQVSMLSAQVNGAEGTQLAAAVREEKEARAQADEAYGRLLQEMIVQVQRDTPLVEDILNLHDSNQKLAADMAAYYHSIESDVNLLGEAWLKEKEFLLAQIQLNSSLIAEEKIIRASEKEALAQEISKVAADVIAGEDRLTSLIQQESMAYANQVEALAQQIDTLTASIESPDSSFLSALREEREARAQADETYGRFSQQMISQKYTEIGEGTVEGILDEYEYRKSNSAYLAGYIHEVETRLNEADEAFAKERSALLAQIDQTRAAIIEESIVRAAKDFSFASSLDSLYAQVINNRDEYVAMIQEERQARADSEGALVSSLMEMIAESSTEDVEELRTLIYEERLARASADNTYGNITRTLISEKDQEVGEGQVEILLDLYGALQFRNRETAYYYYSLDTKINAAGEAEASEREALVAQVNQARSAIVEESILRASDKEALTKRIDSTISQLNDEAANRAAAISTLQETIVNDKQVLAQQISDLSATVQGLAGGESLDAVIQDKITAELTPTGVITSHINVQASRITDIVEGVTKLAGITKDAYTETGEAYSLARDIDSVNARVQNIETGETALAGVTQERDARIEADNIHAWENRAVITQLEKDAGEASVEAALHTNESLLEQERKLAVFYSSLESDIKESKEAYARRYEFLIAQIDKNLADIRSEEIVRAASDYASAQLINQLYTRVEENEAAYSETISLISNLESTTASIQTLLNAEVNTNRNAAIRSAILEESEVTSGKFATQGKNIYSLFSEAQQEAGEAEVDIVLATNKATQKLVREFAIFYQSLQTRVREGEMSEAEARNLLAAKLGQAEAAINTLNTVIAAKDAAMARRIDTIQATLNDEEAVIEHMDSVVAGKATIYRQNVPPSGTLKAGDVWVNGDKISKWSGANWLPCPSGSTMDYLGKTTAASWVKTQVKANGKTVLTGIGALSDEAGSEVIVLADKFYVVGTMDQNEYQPFYFDTTTGKMVISGNLVVQSARDRDGNQLISNTGWIRGEKIAADSRILIGRIGNTNGYSIVIDGPQNMMSLGNGSIVLDGKPTDPEIVCYKDTSNLNLGGTTIKGGSVYVYGTDNQIKLGNGGITLKGTANYPKIECRSHPEDISNSDGIDITSSTISIVGADSKISVGGNRIVIDGHYTNPSITLGGGGVKLIGTANSPSISVGSGLITIAAAPTPKITCVAATNQPSRKIEISAGKLTVGSGQIVLDASGTTPKIQIYNDPTNPTGTAQMEITAGRLILGGGALVLNGYANNPSIQCFADPSDTSGQRITINSGNIYISGNSKIELSSQSGYLAIRDSSENGPYVKMISGDVTTYRYLGGYYRPMKNLKRVEVMKGLESGKTYRIPGFWSNVPKVIVSPNNVRTYDSLLGSTTQNLITRVQSLDYDSDTGICTITPEAVLRVSDGQVVIGTAANPVTDWVYGSTNSESSTVTKTTQPGNIEWRHCCTLETPYFSLPGVVSRASINIQLYSNRMSLESSQRVRLRWTGFRFIYVVDGTTSYSTAWLLSYAAPWATVHKTQFREDFADNYLRNLTMSSKSSNHQIKIKCEVYALTYSNQWDTNQTYIQNIYQGEVDPAVDSFAAMRVNEVTYNSTGGDVVVKGTVDCIAVSD